ncbi:hypothetical protein F5Y14DRAFT_359861 [Nemania sp. NC0429]|nr:hypothetical protein F5Y14DRAFT_359861 [Nemania sp. NC0429]
MRGPQHEHNDRSSVRSPEVHSAEPVLMPPPYSASGPDPSGESRAFVRKRPAWPTAVALISLHLVAGFYALQFLLQYWTSSQAPLGPPPTYNVAIIGAGPAGIAAAQRLRTSPRARGLRFNITIYEAKPVLGGALALCGANGSLVFPKDDTTQSPITAEDIAGKGLAWSNELFTRDSERVLGDSVHFLELTPEKIGP